MDESKGSCRWCCIIHNRLHRRRQGYYLRGEASGRHPKARPYRNPSSASYAPGRPYVAPRYPRYPALGRPVTGGTLPGLGGRESRLIRAATAAAPRRQTGDQREACAERHSGEYQQSCCLKDSWNRRGLSHGSRRSRSHGRRNWRVTTRMARCRGPRGGRPPPETENSAATSQVWCRVCGTQCHATCVYLPPCQPPPLSHPQPHFEDDDVER
eukprot:COSAG01_NODE_831_length_13260_cov_79.998784_6_plen_212_part_00